MYKEPFGNAMCQSARLARGAASTDQGKNVVRAQKTRNLKGTDNAFALGGDSKVLAERNVVDEDRALGHDLGFVEALGL